MTDKEATELIEKFNNGECTPEEKALVTSWYLDMEAQAAEPVHSQEDENEQERIWQLLNKKRRPVYYYYWPAAAVLLFSLVYFMYREKPVTDVYSYNQQHDVPAGSNKAILTLANGKQINLDEAKNGSIANQGGISISKNQNGQIVYNVTSSSQETGYNTITTPNGGQYEIILPDGSHVYLNAASSLKYPIKFTGAERRVTLIGECYFEITKNVRPFIVLSGDQTVKVLGTHFNISCYPDEPIKTTLAEGKVLVSLTSSSFPSTSLDPGQQVINTGAALQVNTVNVDNEIAWKDGLFVFNQSTIKSVLQQICRWYDVTVDYSSLPERRFDGEIPRDAPLSKILKAIEVTNHVKFKIEGKQITIQQ